MARLLLAAMIFLAGDPGLSHASPTIDRSVLGAGGGLAAAGNLELRTTVGQSVVGVADAGTHQVRSGFWPGGGGSTVSVGGGEGEVPRGDSPPLAFRLERSFPNPAPGRATIAFDIPHPTSGALAIFDPRGRRVRTLVQGTLDPGHIRVVWDGRAQDGTEMPAGVYLYSLTTPEFHAARRLVLLR